MVIQCVVFKCSNRQSVGTKERGVSFFRFPKDLKKRKAWVKAVNRADWAPNEYSRICSEHFVDGWHSDDPSDVNYRPTIFSYKEKASCEADSARHDRKCRRNLLQDIDNKFSKISFSHFTSFQQMRQGSSSFYKESLSLLICFFFYKI